MTFKHVIISILALTFIFGGITSFVVGKARMAMEVQNEKQFCTDRGFTDIQVCREWWIKAGDPSRKR